MREGIARDFITPLRKVCNLKLMNYLLLEFSIYYFVLGLAWATETMQSKTAERGFYPSSPELT
jgi:hypothetical protein